MKQFLYLLLAGFFIMAACTKEETPAPTAPECERLNYGLLCFKNSTSTPVRVWVDSKFRFTLTTGETRCVDSLSASVHKYSAEQVVSSGTPAVWGGEQDIIACQSKTFTLIR